MKRLKLLPFIPLFLVSLTSCPRFTSPLCSDPVAPTYLKFKHDSIPKTIYVHDKISLYVRNDGDPCFDSVTKVDDGLIAEIVDGKYLHALSPGMVTVTIYFTLFPDIGDQITLEVLEIPTTLE